MCQRVFKIKDKRTGLFMTGRGSYPQWSDAGRVYTTVAACKSALKTRRLYAKKIKPVIIEYMLVPTGDETDVVFE